MPGYTDNNAAITRLSQKKNQPMLMGGEHRLGKDWWLQQTKQKINFKSE